MTVTERQRREFYERVAQRLGQETADILMEYLPPIGWSDVARRADIEALRADFHRDQSRLLLALLTTQFVLGAVFVLAQAFA